MNGAATLVSFLLLGAVGYMLLIRPQRSVRRRRADMMSRLGEGDEVITIGGLYGVVRDIADTTVDLEVSQGVIVRFDRRAISAITSDTQPSYDAAGEPDQLPDDETASVRGDGGR
jgi:preprotein translocase subunit YajC